MKKSLLLIAVMAFVGAATAVAQPRAIGGRLGLDPQVSYQHGFGESNMLSVDAGFVNIFRGVQGAVTYDWINPFGASFENIWEHKGEWNWYMGVGAGTGVSFRGNTYINGERLFESISYIGVAARVGVEYNFWFPLQLSVDYRPVFGPGFHTSRIGGERSTHTYFYGSGQIDNNAAVWVAALALSVRYKF